MEDIIKEIREGNLSAFKNAYEEYSPKLYFFIFKYCQSKYLAEETVQLTFIKLWEKRDGLSSDVDLSVQIFRTAKSLLIDLLRKEKTYNSLKTAIDNEAYSFEKGEQLILDREQLQLIKQKIENLPYVRKKVFKMSRIECRSNQDIAEELSVSIKTVESHISLALKELKNISVIVLIILLK